MFREEAALGKYLVVDGVAYQVIGIYEGEDRDQLPDVYVPLSTAQRIYNPAEGYRNINFMVEGSVSYTHLSDHFGNGGGYTCHVVWGTGACRLE